MDFACLGIDGKIYHVKGEARLLFDADTGMPIGYEQPKLPNVQLVVCVADFRQRELEEHPLRKAFYKLWAAKAHNIIEKQRPQDVTIAEAEEMMRVAQENALKNLEKSC